MSKVVCIVMVAVMQITAAVLPSKDHPVQQKKAFFDKLLRNRHPNHVTLSDSEESPCS